MKLNIKSFVAGALFTTLLTGSVAFAASATSIDVYFQPLKYFFDGSEKKAPDDQQGFIYQGTTYVPLRFVSEALGKQVGYDGATTSIYVGKQKEGTVTYMEELKTLTSGKNYADPVTTFTTNTGTQFTHGYKIGSYTGTYGSDRGSLYNKYLLNGNYKRFQASIAPGEQWNNFSKTPTIGLVKIFADDKQVFTSGDIASDITSPIIVDLDLTGVLSLRVEISDAFSLGLLDAKFTN